MNNAHWGGGRSCFISQARTNRNVPLGKARVLLLGLGWGRAAAPTRRISSPPTLSIPAACSQVSSSRIGACGCSEEGTGSAGHCCPTARSHGSGRPSHLLLLDTEPVPLISLCTRHTAESQLALPGRNHPGQNSFWSS